MEKIIRYEEMNTLYEIAPKTEEIALIVKLFSSEEFEGQYHYDGELGAIYSENKTEFIIWAPTAKNVALLIYDKDNIRSMNMNRGHNGEWYLTLNGDCKNIYYNYEVDVYGERHIVVDPYAKAVGVNGEKSMVIDLENTNPEGWEYDKKPELISPTDAILYEMHIRDFSIDENSGVCENNKGKYLGLVEDCTKLTGTEIKTTFDHLKELGITHVHLLPTFDFESVDEENNNSKEYNWGYDPKNFNALEGSYSSNAFDGNVRVEEFKQAILKFHKARIRVVMDVVYNHTFNTKNNCLNLAVPYYYHRVNENGEFSNGTGCGNETASERSMVRKYIVDSVKHFAKEYHIDGFRFDLMAVHDIETMKEVRRELDKIDKTIIVYGEGWNGGDSSLRKEDAAFKNNTRKFNTMQIACFSDDIRDAIKGDVFIASNKGFVNGATGKEEAIKSGIVASLNNKVKAEENCINIKEQQGKAWACEPYQTINYDSAHDNYTLWDKLKLSAIDESEENLIKMNKMAAAIVLTSQGIPFLHCGEEFLRTKTNEDGSFEENSYKSSDLVNKIDWKRKQQYIEVFNYYKGLIELRKSYKEFRLNTAQKIRENITFLNKGEAFENDQVVGFRIKDEHEIIVIYNANKYDIKFKIPDGKWGVLVKANLVCSSVTEIIKVDSIDIEKLSTFIIISIN